MNLKKIGLTLAVAAGISLGATGVAHAAASASSEYTMTGLIFTDNSNGDGTGNQLDISDFDAASLNFTSTAGINGTLTGPDGGGFLDSGFSVAANPIDLAGDCVGDGCPGAGPLGGENNFAPNPGYPSTGNYSSADQYELGSPITGLNPSVPSSATISQGSWSGVDTGSQFSSANADNNLNATFEFTLAGGLPNGAGITFDFETYVEVFTDAGEIAPTTATASATLAFQLFQNNADGTQTLIFSWNPGESIIGGTEVAGSDITNVAGSRQAPANGRSILAGGAVGVEASDSFAAYTLALVSGQSYTLEARSNTKADVLRQQPIPEPSVLAIFGAGFVGMALMRRRRKMS